MFHSPAPLLAASAIGLAPVTWSVGILEPAVAGYALRLHRNLGARVGWWLFTTFCLLALGHLLQAAGVTVRVLGPSVSFDFIAVLVPLLLLIGMAHTESVLGHRVRAERKAANLRVDNDIVAEVVRENEGLQQQITRLSERAQVLQESAQQYSALFAENPQPMWLFDRQSMRILDANNAALGQYGFTMDEFLDKAGPDILAAEEVAAFMENVAQPAWGDLSVRVWRHRRRDGASFEVEVRELDLKYAGCPARLILATDISRRAQPDSALQQQHQLQISEEPPPVPSSSPLPQTAPPPTEEAVAETTFVSMAEPVAQKAASASRTILLVEPDSRLRAMARTVLEWNGHRVVETDSCSLAETVWPSQGESIDLLVTELALPGTVSGRELAARLRERKPELKILFIYDSDKPLNGAEPLTGAEFVGKPFTSAALLARLNDCFPQNG
jgi:PAS domain S-box-containing protein